MKRVLGLKKTSASFLQLSQDQEQQTTQIIKVGCTWNPSSRIQLYQYVQIILSMKAHMSTYNILLFGLKVSFNSSLEPLVLFQTWRWFRFWAALIWAIFLIDYWYAYLSSIPSTYVHRWQFTPNKTSGWDSAKIGWICCFLSFYILWELWCFTLRHFSRCWWQEGNT